MGDWVGVGLSSLVLVRAWRAGARKRTLARMLVNLGLEGLVGSVPLAGDLTQRGPAAPGHGEAGRRRRQRTWPWERTPRPRDAEPSPAADRAAWADGEEPSSTGFAKSP